MPRPSTGSRAFPPTLPWRTIARAAIGQARRIVADGRAAATDENVMPHLVDCARAYASEGEICDALRAVWGVYRETPVF